MEGIILEGADHAPIFDSRYTPTSHFLIEQMLRFHNKNIQLNPNGTGCCSKLDDSFQKSRNSQSRPEINIDKSEKNMKIKNSLLIDKINKAIISHNEKTKNEQINLITSEEIQIEDLKKLNIFQIDICDISMDDKDNFFEELGILLEHLKLECFFVYSSIEKTSMEINLEFLSKLNKDLENLSITEIDLSNTDSSLFSNLENLKLLTLGNNNIKNFDITSNLNENVIIDVGNNPIDNLSINEVVNEVKRRNGRIYFNNHPYLNAIVFALKNIKIDFSTFKIPENKMCEMFQFYNDYKIEVPVKIEDFKKIGENLENISSIIISGTKDISTEFLIDHPQILKIQIIDKENPGDMEQQEPYSREDFIQIRQKIDEIKEQIEIPDESDPDREKKIFMQVYTLLGKMIDYNHYAVTEDGRKDDDLAITCRNLKDGLLKGKAVCAGYADILKNVLGEFNIKANYIGRQPENIEKYAERMGYYEQVELSEIWGEEIPDMMDFVKQCGYQDDHGHAWNSVLLDGEKYLCDLTWDADNIKLDHFPLEYCCPSLWEFSHDIFETIDEGEISEFSSEDQLRFLGFSKEEIDKKLYPSLDDFMALFKNSENQRKLEACAVSISSEIKTSDLDGIEKAFDDKEKEEQISYDK